MANGDPVRVDVDGVRRAHEDGFSDEVWVEFVPADARPAIRATATAIDAANDVTPVTSGESPVPSMAGCSVKVRDIANADVLATWLSAFAGALATGGRSGLVHATPMTFPPEWVRTLRGPRITAFLAHDGEFASLDALRREELYDRPTPPALAGWCERAVAWAAAAGGGEAYLAAGGIAQSDPTGDVAAHLAATLQSTTGGTVTYAAARAGRAAHVNVAFSGQTVCAVYDVAATPVEQALRVRDAILVNAASTGLAFVAAPSLWASSWADRQRALPPLPTVPGWALRDRGELWHRYVPDAHAIQLLTGEHMARVTDVTAWNVTPVGDRYLVEARDLTAWFNPDGPSESIVEAARADFGAAIVPASALT